jgi:hypothetical protein
MRSVTPSAVAERFRGWATAEAPVAALTRFRVAFAAIWLAYDLLDLFTEGTAHCNWWMYPEAPARLILIQLGLIVCEAVMLRGVPAALIRPAILLAFALRAYEWNEYLNLNDFAYYAVTAIILVHAAPVGGLGRIPKSDVLAPAWPKAVLVYEAAWIYFATGMMKVNPVWLSGRHLYVRLEYIRYAFGWPYPGVLTRCADSLPCDSVLAIMGVLGELSLAALLVFYPRRRIVTLVAIGIHGFGAVATNVWFFGPSLIAQIWCLTEDGPPRGERA